MMVFERAVSGVCSTGRDIPELVRFCWTKFGGSSKMT